MPKAQAPRAPRTNEMAVIKAAVSLAERRTFNHLLYVGDRVLPDDVFRGKPRARRKLVQAVMGEAQQSLVEAAGIPVVALPAYELTRQEKLKLALLSGIARGLYREGEVVVGLVSRRPTGMPDSILVVTVGQDDDEGSFGFIKAEGVAPEVLDALVDLAVSIGVEGWEGRPMGALFVVGCTTEVMEKSRQLTLNPFQGYSEDEKNLLNPEVRHSLRAFAVLDGAFVLREDGVVVAAGRYLNFEQQDIDVPLGLGARHMAAAGISRDTEATAIVVSQTSGAVRIFRHGRVALELAARGRRS